MIFDLCPPAIIYVIFSLTQIIIDTIHGMYNTAFIKVIIMIMITFLLQILCQNGLNVVSWIIVFIPFIFMTVITSIVLYLFGLNAATGSLDTESNDNNVPIERKKNNTYNSYNSYIYSNPQPSTYPEQNGSSSTVPSGFSSSPAYQG